MFNQLRKSIAQFISPAKNAMTLANAFLRGGNKAMTPDWTQVVMNDPDLYTGYSYAAIRNRANATARIAIEHIQSKSTDKNNEDFVHPHLETIAASPTFTNYQFWYTISTYLDLEGVYYLLAVRNFTQDGSRIGAVKEFKMLNPYQVKRVIKVENGQAIVGGYLETKNGYIRELPKEMIIDIRELNPFNDNEPYAMTDASKESQFTLKTTGDYTRHTLKHNINAPGILSTDVVLSDQDFQNFTSRVKGHTKGEPIFGNGKGVISWDSMNIDLSKSALKEVNDQNRDVLFSVSGVSKTMMGIEESGTTRETAKTQKDLMVEGQILPRIQLIIDALNQDYRNSYPDEYLKTKAEIIVDNPNATDHDANLKDTEGKTKNFDLYTKMLNAGFDAEIAGQFISGKVDIEELGEPKNPPKVDPVVVDTKPVVKKQEIEHTHDHAVDQKKKILSAKLSSAITQQEGVLQNAVVNIDQHLVADMIVRIQKNDLASESDLVTKTDKNEYINELEAVLVGFYGIVMMLHGGKSMRNRVGELALPGTFTLDTITKAYIKNISKLVAESHIQTVVDDILVSVREAALKGLGQKEIINEIHKKYDATISEVRAKAIARTETNRAFTRAQYEADRQFIKQNKLTGKAFKQWVTRSDNPCAFCESLERQGPIPFGNAFRDLGDSVEVDGKVLTVDFEALQAGNAHTNCSCIYELVIK